MRFDRLVLRFILIFAVVAAGLGFANAQQGPKLSSSEVNEQALIARGGQRALLHANQPLATLDPADVTVSPLVDTTVAVDANTVAVQFESPLRYNTTYSIRVDARGSATGTAGRLEFSFTTPDVSVDSLIRQTGPDELDQIMRHSLAAQSKSTAVVEAPRIQEYAKLGDRHVVVTLDDAGSPSLFITEPSDGSLFPVDTGAAPTIRQLRASSSGDLFGYVLDSGFGAEGEPTARLYLYSLRGSGVPREVLGLDGKPLAVWEWAFVPGTASIVVQDFDQQLFLIETVTETMPRPLGRHAELRGFLPGTAKLVVADSLSESIIDLVKGESTEASLPSAGLPDDAYPANQVLLSESSFVQLYTERMEDGAAGDLASVLVLATPERTTELYRTAAPGSQIGAFCVSPNGEFLAVEVISAGAEPDQYPVVLGFSDTTINFVSLDGGGVRRGVSGFMPDWC